MPKRMTDDKCWLGDQCPEGRVMTLKDNPTVPLVVVNHYLVGPESSPINNQAHYLVCEWLELDGTVKTGDFLEHLLIPFSGKGLINASR
jgi:hypothetical protein